MYVNGHRSPYQRFKELTALKRASEAGCKAWDELVLDNDTRWDSELMLLERVVYFDAELLQLSRDDEYGVPRDCILTAAEFDLAYAMTIILDPFRKFTKFVQNRSKITLAYLPGMLDDLVTNLNADNIKDKLARRSEIIFPQVAAFQEQLTLSLKIRFADIFQGSSLALSARYLLPGPNLFEFANFVLDDEALDRIRENLLDDFEALLPMELSDEEKVFHRGVAAAALPLARRLLDRLDPRVDPLEWWPRQDILSSLFHLAKMLFGIPASSGDNERAFSSAGFTLDKTRSRLNIDSFRCEHRIRRFITGSTSQHTHEGRAKRSERVQVLLELYTKLIQEEEAV